MSCLSQLTKFNWNWDNFRKIKFKGKWLWITKRVQDFVHPKYLVVILLRVLVLLPFLVLFHNMSWAEQDRRPQVRESILPWLVQAVRELWILKTCSGAKMYGLLLLPTQMRRVTTVDSTIRARVAESPRKFGQELQKVHSLYWFSKDVR